MSKYHCCNVRILNHSEIVFHTDVISENKRLKCPFMIPWQAVFALKPRQRNETFFKLCHFYCLSICLILTVFRFVSAKVHFRFHKLSVFWHALLLNKLCQIFERYLTICVLSLTHLQSGILPILRNTCTNRLPFDSSQEQRIRFEIDPFTKC